MIDTESFSPEWISKVAEEHNIGNRAIVERVIHAFALVDTCLPIVFVKDEVPSSPLRATPR